MQAPGYQVSLPCHVTRLKFRNELPAAHLVCVHHINGRCCRGVVVQGMVGIGGFGRCRGRRKWVVFGGVRVRTKSWLPSACSSLQLDFVDRLDTRHSKLCDTVRAMLLAEIAREEGSHRSSSRSHADALQGPGYIWIQPQQRRPIPIVGSAPTSSNGARCPWGCSGAAEG
jgi:hypothetical protein